jgi:hypothetical protein
MSSPKKRILYVDDYDDARLSFRLRPQHLRADGVQLPDQPL